jgi:hypothetical protein
MKKVIYDVIKEGERIGIGPFICTGAYAGIMGSLLSLAKQNDGLKDIYIYIYT